MLNAADITDKNGDGDGDICNTPPFSLPVK
jgi:hypothetical protein